MPCGSMQLFGYLSWLFLGWKQTSHTSLSSSKKKSSAKPLKAATQLSRGPSRTQGDKYCHFVRSMLWRRVPLLAKLSSSPAATYILGHSHVGRQSDHPDSVLLLIAWHVHIFLPSWFLPLWWDSHFHSLKSLASYFCVAFFEFLHDTSHLSWHLETLWQHCGSISCFMNISGSFSQV